MQNHLIFIFYLLFFLFSIVGHGLIFNKLILNKKKETNLGYTGILGIFSISILSLLSSLFLAHGFIHNFLIHGLGLLFFFKFFFENKNINNLRNLIFIFFVFIIGIYIFKNHDDFPYYHLTYALNLVENKFIIGSGAFGHGFRTPSTLFFFHSTLYLPGIEYFLFNSAGFYVLIFFNFIILEKILNSFLKKNYDLSYYFSLLIFSYVNIIFYRLAEYGVDKISQILFFLILLQFLELKKINKNNFKSQIIDKINYILIFIVFASSIKSIYLIYFLLVPILYFNTIKIKKIIFINKKTIFILFFIVFLNQFMSFLSTGCFLYPEKSSCIEKVKWSIPKSEVMTLKTHYSWWSKSGGGPNYSVDVPKEEYIKNFNWTKNWIDNYFFNKVSDNLLGLVLLNLIFILFFFSKKRKKIKLTDYKQIYFIILIFFLVWFFNHPALRYGGYVLIAAPILLLCSQYLASIDLNKKSIKNKSIYLIILTILIFNLKNFNRINKEIKVYKYPIKENPFFRVLKTNYYNPIKFNGLKIYANKDQMCWATPTPCTYNPNLIIYKKFSFFIVKKK